MRFRLQSRAAATGDAAYDFVSEKNSVTYSHNPLPSDTASRSTRQPLREMSPRPVSESTASYSSALVDQAPVVVRTNGHQAKVKALYRRHQLGLPSKWFLVPLPRDHKPYRASVDLHVSDGSDRLSGDLTAGFSGTIDIDWQGRDEPVKIAANRGSVKRAQALGAMSNPESQAHWHMRHKVEPIEFAIAGRAGKEQTDLPWQSQALRRRPQLLTGAQLRNYRRDTRHHIRVVTRNSLGLLTMAALAGVAPHLVIAAMINAYCLASGLEAWDTHKRMLEIHGLAVNRRDVAVAIAEGVVVRLAFMVITIGHSDLLTFTHSFAEPLADGVDYVHHAIIEAAPIVGDLAEDFEFPAEEMRKALGLDTVAEHLGGNGWSESTKEVLENIFIVGAVQAVMENIAEKIVKHAGAWQKWCRYKWDRVFGRSQKSGPPQSNAKNWTADTVDTL